MLVARSAWPERGPSRLERFARIGLAVALVLAGYVLGHLF